jgi:transposase-like protein
MGNVEMECSITITMEKRLCLGCGGELGMAFNPSENARLTRGTGNVGRSTAKWRCSTCGQVFTSEQLRASKRASPHVVGQA